MPPLDPAMSIPPATAGVPVKSPWCDQKLQTTPRLGRSVAAGPAAPPSREFDASLPYWPHVPAPSGWASAGAKMSAGSGFSLVGADAPVAPSPPPAPPPPGPPAPTSSAPCIHECSEQWNLYAPGARASTPLTGADFPPSTSGLANLPSSETRSCLAVESRLLKVSVSPLAIDTTGVA